MVFTRGLLGLSRRKKNKSVRKVYDTIVLQARLPVFYTDYAVPDTVSGRFDLIVLHSFMIFWRLKDQGDVAKEFGQEIFDTFIEDMDRSLREMGVGYQAIPKRIKKMGEAFYGRIAAYDAAFEAQDDDALTEALYRNLYPDNDSYPQNIKDLSDYVQACVDCLQRCDMKQIYAVEFELPDPQTFLKVEANG